MKFPVLWFIAASMTIAFVNLAWGHKRPMEALLLGLAFGSTATAMEMGLFRRLWRRLFPGEHPPHA